MGLGRSEWGLSHMKTKEWVPEAGPKGNADAGHTWSTMSVFFLVYAWGGVRAERGDPGQASGSGFVPDAPRARKETQKESLNITLRKSMAQGVC